MYLVKEYFQNHFVQWLLLVIILFHAVAFGLVAYFIRSDIGLVFLRSNAYVGADLSSVASWQWAYMLPLMGVAIMLMHLMFSMYFFAKKDRLISHMLLLSAALLGAGIIIACVSIVLVNTQF